MTAESRRKEKGRQLIEEILAKSKNGVAPATTNHDPIVYRAKTHFGTWQAACKAAGVLTHRQYSRIKGKQEVLQEIKDKSENGYAPVGDSNVRGRAKNYYGTWAEACKAAGVRFWGPEPPQRWQRDKHVPPLKEKTKLFIYLLAWGTERASRKFDFASITNCIAFVHNNDIPFIDPDDERHYCDF